MHYLVVSEPEQGYFEYEVEHEENCPEQWFASNLIGDGYTDYICDIGNHVSYYGFIDLETDERMKQPGKYEIDWYGHFPTSAFEDNETYIYFVDEEND